MNLVEATAREIARVAELLPRAEGLLLDLGGEIATPLLRQVVNDAASALGTGDAIETLRAYEQLRSIGSAIEQRLTKQGETT